MTRCRQFTHRQNTDSHEQEAAENLGIGQPQDSTNGGGGNDEGGNEQPWSPSTCLQLDQDDEVTGHN